MVAAAVTSDSPSLHQEGISGTPIAWGGTHSTRQVSTLQPWLILILYYWSWGYFDIYGVKILYRMFFLRNLMGFSFQSGGELNSDSIRRSHETGSL